MQNGTMGIGILSACCRARLLIGEHEFCVSFVDADNAVRRCLRTAWKVHMDLIGKQVCALWCTATL